jgi:hypothetical protein
LLLRGGIVRRGYWWAINNEQESGLMKASEPELPGELLHVVSYLQVLLCQLPFNVLHPSLRVRVLPPVEFVGESINMEVEPKRQKGLNGRIQI